MLAIRNVIGSNADRQHDDDAKDMAAGIMNSHAYGYCTPAEKEPRLGVIPAHPKHPPSNPHATAGGGLGGGSRLLGLRRSFGSPSGLHGFSQRTFYRPVKIVQPIFNAVPTDASLAAPLHDSLCLAVERDVAVVSSIVLLLLHTGPTAIRRFVVAIRVNPFKRVFWRWSRSHVTVKVLKLLPFRAVSDAATSVVLILPVGLKVASLLHRAPNAPNLGVRHVVFRAVAAHLGVNLFIIAPARCRGSVAEALPIGKRLIAAIAKAMPSRLSALSVQPSSLHDKAAKTLTRKINECWHKMECNPLTAINQGI